MAEGAAIEANGLTFSLLPGADDVLKQVSLTLPRGARCVVVGPNGAGKSTMLELLSGGKMAPAGQVKVCGEDPFRGSSGSKVTLVQGGWRGNAANCMDSSRVREVLGRLAEATEPRLRRLRAALDVDALLDRFMGSLSDGQRRRVELGRRLQDEREVILLDEATADLDILARRSLLEFLQEDGVTVLNVTHVFDSLEPWATHVLQLHAGAVVRCEPAPFPSGPGGLFAIVAGWIVEASAADPNADIGMMSPPALEKPAEVPGGFALEVCSLSFGYEEWCPKSLVVESLRLPFGCRCALMGLNGSGKSTLLSILAGRRLVRSGQVNVLGHVAFRDHQVLDPQVAILSTEWKKQIADLSSARSLTFKELADSFIREAVENGGDMAAIAGRMVRLIQTLGVDPTKPLGALSDGNLRRAQIALKLLRPAKLILMDEVTADLDVPARKAVLTFLQEESEAGCAVVYCTHILDGLDGWATHFARARPGGHGVDCTELGPQSAAPLAELVIPMLQEDSQLPRAQETPPPLPKAAKFSGDAALPTGWDRRSTTQASAFGDHSWNAEKGPEENWSFASVAPKPGFLPGVASGPVGAEGAGPAGMGVGSAGMGGSQSQLPPGWGDRHGAGSLAGHSWTTGPTPGVGGQMQCGGQGAPFGAQGPPFGGGGGRFG